MKQFNQPRIPQNLIVNIIGEKIYLKNLSDEMTEAIKIMKASQTAFSNDLLWLIECVNEEDVIKTLLELNRLGFLFTGGPAGYPAADVFEFLLERNNLTANFREVRWRGPGDWYIIER